MYKKLFSSDSPVLWLVYYIFNFVCMHIILFPESFFCKQQGLVQFPGSPNNFAGINSLNLIIIYSLCHNFVKNQSIYNWNSQQKFYTKLLVTFDSLFNCHSIRNHSVNNLYHIFPYYIHIAVHIAWWRFCCKHIW